MPCRVLDPLAKQMGPVSLSSRSMCLIEKERGSQTLRSPKIILLAKQSDYGNSSLIIYLLDEGIDFYR